MYIVSLRQNSFLDLCFGFPQVKDLENSVAELLDLYGDCAHRSSAIQSVANGYQPGEQVNRLLLHVLI